MLFLGGLTI